MIQQKQSISVTEFKANFDAIIEYVYKHRKSIIITKYKKPIAKLIPFERNSI